MKVFVSYAQIGDDLPNVRAFTRGLTTALGTVAPGSTVFQDERGEIEPGDDLQDELGAALDESDVLLVLLTREWFERPWCRWEYEHFTRSAVSERVGRILPVLWDATPGLTLTSDDTIARELANVRRDDWSTLRHRGWDDSEVEACLRALAARLRGLAESAGGAPDAVDADNAAGDRAGMLVFAAFAALGIAANFLAGAAGQFRDTLGRPHTYGFLSTTYWSVALPTTIPIALGASFAALLQLRPGRARLADLVPWVPVWTTAVPAALTALRFTIEIPPHLHRRADDVARLHYCQWSDLHDGCTSSPGVLRIVLFVWCYLVVVATYWLMLRAAATLALWAVVLSGRAADRLKPSERRVAVTDVRVAAARCRTVILAYVWHLALVRAAKVDMRLRLGPETDTLPNALGSWMQRLASESYWQLMPPVFFYNLVWILLVLFIVTAARASATAADTIGDTRRPWSQTFLTELRDFPPGARDAFIAAVVLVLFPPPSRYAALNAGIIVVLVLWIVAAVRGFVHSFRNARAARE